LSRASAVIRAAIGRQGQHQPATAVTPVASDAADATPTQATTTSEATRITAEELPQMLTSGEPTQTEVPDVPTARGGAVCASSAAADVTRAEDATSGLEVVPPAAGSAAPVPQTTGKPTEVVVMTNGTMAAQVDSLAVVATTDGAAKVSDGLTMGTHEASGSTALKPTASRERTNKAAEPATRRSARIRERSERHVHWATVAPDARQPAAPRTAPRAALDAIGTPPSREDGDDAGRASGIDGGGDEEAPDEGHDEGEHDEGDDRDGGRCSDDSERDKQRRGDDERLGRLGQG
ncbi:hypothetical protein PF010_g31337, partial [Phytophthora fragariae]